jgi:hypothetical protein
VGVGVRVWRREREQQYFYQPAGGTSPNKTKALPWQDGEGDNMTWAMVDIVALSSWWNSATCSVRTASNTLPWCRGLDLGMQMNLKYCIAFPIAISLC